MIHDFIVYVLVDNLDPLYRFFSLYKDAVDFAEMIAEMPYVKSVFIWALPDDRCVLQISGN